MKRGTVTEKTVAVPFLERRQPMEDTAILELYWARDEQAIAETQKSYGKYCYSIAYVTPSITGIIISRIAR